MSYSTAYMMARYRDCLDMEKRFKVGRQWYAERITKRLVGKNGGKYEDGEGNLWQVSTVCGFPTLRFVPKDKRQHYRSKR